MTKCGYFSSFVMIAVLAILDLLALGLLRVREALEAYYYILPAILWSESSFAIVGAISSREIPSISLPFSKSSP